MTENKIERNRKNREKYNSASSEEKQKRKAKRHEEHLRKITDMTPEQLVAHKLKTRLKWEDFDKNLTPEQKEQRHKSQYESNQRWWHTLPLEEKQKHLASMKQRNHNMTTEQKEQEKQRLSELRKDPKRKIEMREYGKKYREQLRILVISHYSNGTMHCMNPKCEVPGGAKDIRALCIDHINGGGRQHAQEVGNHVYYWIVKHKFPSGFQVLCQSCNIIKKIENKEDYKRSKSEAKK